MLNIKKHHGDYYHLYFEVRNIFIIHGSYGHPEENWFPWLKKELETLKHQVIVPKFPIHSDTTSNHRLNEWIEEFLKYKEFVNKETIIVAHSRGCSFCLQLLPVLNMKINSMFFVGPFIDYDQWRPEVYTEYDSFQAKPYLWKKVRKLVDHIEIFQSTDDVIPVCEGQFIAYWLHAEFILVKNAKHFNVAEDPSYDHFPLLLDRIKNRL